MMADDEEAGKTLPVHQTPDNATNNTNESSELSMSSLEAESILQEANLSRIRNTVNANKIKLWIPPYYDKVAGKPAEDEMLQLAHNLAPSLEMSDVDILSCLVQLQQNALEKLAAREKFASGNTCMLRIKLSRNLSGNDAKRSLSVLNVSADCTGLELAEHIAEFTLSSARVAPRCLRLISGGKVLSGHEPISGQNVKPGATVMVLELDADDESLAIVNEQRRILELAKNDAELLASNDKDDPDEGSSLQIEDQSGKHFDLPSDERKYLILAMSLHEKGKAAMKRLEHELALVLLLEAMEEYRKCGSELLNSVDNYALLNLDVAWCYLHLGNVNELPNAEERLSECEATFARCYGANLERLAALKGTSGEEYVLFVRMHLLQAIVAFHTGHTNIAIQLLRKVDAEIKTLLVPDDLLEEVQASCGCSESEARLALRATEKDVVKAVRHIHEHKRKKEEVRKEEVERQRKRRNLGKTQDGSWINLGYLNTLKKMNYEEKLAASALRHTNNDISAAIEVINENPEFLVEEQFFNDSDVTDSMVDTVRDMGFNVDDNEIKEALIECKGNVEEVIDFLSDPMRDRKRQMKVEKAKAKREAINRMKDELGNEEDHLNVTLDEEKEFLERYKSILGL